MVHTRHAPLAVNFVTKRPSTRTDMRTEGCLNRAHTFCAPCLSCPRMLAAGLGEPDGGWHYKYPIHEVPDNQLTAYQGAQAPLASTASWGPQPQHEEGFRPTSVRPWWQHPLLFGSGSGSGSSAPLVVMLRPHAGLKLALHACMPFPDPTEHLESCGKCCAGRAGLSLRVVVEAFIPQAGMRSFKKSRDRWEFDDLPLLRSLHAKDPNDTR